MRGTKQTNRLAHTQSNTSWSYDHTFRAIFSCHFFANALLLHIPFLRNLDTSSYLHFLLQPPTTISHKRKKPWPESTQ